MCLKKRKKINKFEKRIVLLKNLINNSSVLKNELNFVL